MWHNGKGIIPPFLVDNSNAKTEASIYSAIDFGSFQAMPMDSVQKLANFKLLGFGGVIQSKFYTLNNAQGGSWSAPDMIFDSLVDIRMILILFLKPSLTISQLLQ